MQGQLIRVVAKTEEDYSRFVSVTIDGREVHADALATHQSVMQVLAAARLAGLPALAFSTRSGAAN